jgi:hypothetical protein
VRNAAARPECDFEAEHCDAEEPALSSSRYRVCLVRLSMAVFLALLLLPLLTAQSSPTTSAATAFDANQVAGQVYTRLLGHWAGMLEYRKFPSDKRLLLPAWLEVTEAADGKSLNMRYTFDDGSNDVMRETQRVTISPTLHMWTAKPIAQPENVYKVEGFEKLKDGLGTLVLTNSVTENLVKEEARTSVMIGRNVFIMDQEARAPGQEYSFRHVYRFTRTEEPRDTSAFPSAPSPRK